MSKQNLKSQLYFHILGIFIINSEKTELKRFSKEERAIIIEKYPFVNTAVEFEEFIKKLSTVKELISEDCEIINPFNKIPDSNILEEINSYIKEIKPYATQYTKRKISLSVTKDIFVNQAITELDELIKTKNQFSTRLKEYLLLYIPERVNKISDYVLLSQDLIEDKIETSQNTMGGVLSEEDKSQIKKLAQFIISIDDETQSKEKYLENLVTYIAPNITFISGAHITARLIAHAGDLKRLSRLPASTIQMYGAEKALFRHLITRAKPPKYGYLLQHILVSNAKQKYKGKIARVIADQICIAAKVDYFKGEFFGKILKEKIDKQIKRITRR